MLEIFALLFLCGKNSKNARMRGRKGGGFIGLTIGLWVGGEIVGFIIGGAIGLDMLPAYGLAIALGIAGGVASYFIAKNCAPGDIEYIENAPPQNAQLLSEPEIPANPALAYRLIGGSTLLMLIGSFTFSPYFGRIFALTNEIVMMAFTVLLAAAAYLILQWDNKSKLAGGISLLIGGLIQAVCGAHLLLYGKAMRAAPLGHMLGSAEFMARLKLALISALIVGAIAAIAAHKFKDAAQKRLKITAWGSTAAILLYRIFAMRAMLAMPNLPGYVKAINLLNGLTDALCVALFLYIIHMLCTLKSKELMVGKGAKIWFIICVVATLSTVIAGFISKTMGIANALVALFGVFGYILLMRNRRVGFPLVLLAVLMTVAAGFSAGMNQSADAALLPLAGLLNPLIAWLLIRRGWNYQLSEEALLQQEQAEILPPKAPVKRIFKICAIINTLLGAALFVGGLGTVLGVGYFQPGPFFGGVIPGGVITALGITALVQCFSKKVASRKWLRITQLVMTGGVVLVFLIAIISALTH